MNVKHSNIVLPNPQIHIYPEKGTIKYKTLLMDPPWATQQRGKLGAENHYDLMSDEAIMALPVNDLLEDNGYLWLWMTNAMIPKIPQFMDAWGLTYRSIFTWCKPRLGLGSHYLRNCTEQMILATKGKALIQFRSQMNYGFFPVQDHSHKPEEVYEIIERCSPGPYLELFARQRHPGWHVWGREIDSDIVIDDQPVPHYTENAKEWLKAKKEVENA